MNHLIPPAIAASQDDATVEQFNLPAVQPDPDDPNGLHWTFAKMAAFLRMLSATHSVSEAARIVGMSRQSAYKLRARLKGQPFDLAWDCVTRRQYDALAQAALERAIHGVEVPHFHKGELIHTSRRYDERLTVAMLAMRNRLAPLPPRYGRWDGLADPDQFEDLVDCVELGGEYWSNLEPLRAVDEDEQEEDE